jgi:hypothetical protein
MMPRFVSGTRLRVTSHVSRYALTESFFTAQYVAFIASQRVLVLLKDLAVYT